MDRLMRLVLFKPWFNKLYRGEHLLKIGSSLIKENRGDLIRMNWGEFSHSFGAGSLHELLVFKHLERGVNR
jgi:hypothetical protein